MDPVSNANRIAMLLRQRLEERARAGAGARAGRKETGVLEKGAVRGVHAVDELDDRRLRRVIIENILADQLGAGLVNDASFQQVVDHVTEAISGDEGGAQMLAEVIADLRARR